MDAAQDPQEDYARWFSDVFAGMPLMFSTWTYRDPSPAQIRRGYSVVGRIRASRAADRLASSLTIDRSGTGAVVVVEGSSDTRFHLHSMSSGTRAAFVSSQREWSLKNGFVLWSPISSMRATERVAMYVAKYCVKDQGKYMAFGGDLWLRSQRT